MTAPNGLARTGCCFVFFSLAASWSIGSGSEGVSSMLFQDSKDDTLARASRKLPIDADLRMIKKLISSLHTQVVVYEDNRHIYSALKTSSSKCFVRMPRNSTPNE